MQRTKINWPGLTHSWNPVVGCQHNCPYCYARRMNDRFGWIERWDRPQFFPERLSRPWKVKKPAKVFVGSMCDLFGNWVPMAWIDSVITVMVECKHHEFMLLTKNPRRYMERHFPANVWLGATIEDCSKVDRLHHMEEVARKSNNKTFLSIEPIQGYFDGTESTLSIHDLIIVGADSNPGADPPEPGWAKSIKHPNIHLKENILKYMEE